MFSFLEGMGVFTVLILIVILLFLPLILTVIVGVALANALGFTGIVWWAFVILFYLVIMGILTTRSN